jgi:catechol 2,3-dioxygenase-like lactoylglutathione lyase family enzyme
MPAMLDHISITVANVEKAKAFYEAALKPIGVSVVMSVSAEETGSTGFYGFGEGQKPYFWIAEGDKRSGPMHIALAADARARVDAFYKAAMAAGAKDNGPPGIRAHYHPNYYGAFVIDPDGHNLEAVCHLPA